MDNKEHANQPVYWDVENFKLLNLLDFHLHFLSTIHKYHKIHYNVSNLKLFTKSIPSSNKNNMIRTVDPKGLPHPRLFHLKKSNRTFTIVLSKD